MNLEICPSCNADMELAEPFCRNCGWRRPEELGVTPRRRSRLFIILISACAVLAVTLIGCHLLLKNITSPERSMDPMRVALQSSDEALFLELIDLDGHDEQAATLFETLHNQADAMYLSNLADAVREVHKSGLHQIIRGDGEEPLLRLYLENRFGLYPVVKFAIAPGFGQSETKIEASGVASVVTMDEMTEEPLSAEEALKVVGDLLDTIYDVFWVQGEELKGNGYKDPNDFDVLRPLLLESATVHFTDGFLKKSAPVFYCDCDAKVFPYTSLGVRFKLVEASADRFVASSIEFADIIDNAGYTIYYTVVKEDGVWKMDDFKEVSPTEEPMNVTAGEILAHMKRFNSDVKIEKEIEYKGSKLFIVGYGGGEVYDGIYADSTKIEFDILEYLESEGLQLSGNLSLPTLPLTRDQAEAAVKEHLRIGEYDVTKVAYDHDNERGHYVMLVYEIVDAGTQYERLATIGWYGVDPQTGRVYDAMFGE